MVQCRASLPMELKLSIEHFPIVKNIKTTIAAYNISFKNFLSRFISKDM